MPWYEIEITTRKKLAVEASAEDLAVEEAEKEYPLSDVEVLDGPLEDEESIDYLHKRADIILKEK